VEALERYLELAPPETAVAAIQQTIRTLRDQANRANRATAAAQQ
jgi:hypothetical protein